ncbi:hypothetical protein [Chelativorans sp. AA-79]|uniref:hypothetical protein n=1 Tax=Chelativorans sp. AA-79 TaxID=3028735 RepID=UPI0023F66627|nr:hypothetical protein [Chelativorans sp. AA-79]WEX10279.1 hypothetical protein PVE73_04790 [Chelativorans sp. AA-79]
MSASKARLGAGNVEIELDGETVVLKPTLLACQTLSRQAGGLSAAVEAVGRMDFDMLVSVIALGLNKKPNDVADAVWRTGMTNLIAPAIRFLTIVSNGGRPLEGTGGSEDEENPQDA